ncbi:hypothetical protein D3C74_366160 [compost metagenome]
MAAYLNTAVFHDRAGRIGQLLLDLGNYYKLESGVVRPNDTEMSMLLRTPLQQVQLVGKLTGEHFDHLEQYVEEIEARLEQTELECSDAGLVAAELRNGIHFVKHAVQLARIKKQLADRPSTLQPELIHRQIKDLDILLHHYRQLWVQRNRTGGLAQSVSKLVRLRAEYTRLAAELIDSAAL